MIYEKFTAGVKNAVFTPVEQAKSPTVVNGSHIKYSSILPQPQQCPRQKSCKGGLESICSDGYEGPLCEICSAGYYKQLKTCTECPMKKWIIGQLSILAAVI